MFKNPAATRRARGSLYGVLLVVVSVLVHLGFFHQPEPSSATLVSSGRLLARFGALDAASANADRVLLDDPDHLGGQLLRAFVLERREQLEPALHCYVGALDDATDKDVRRDIQLFAADLQRRLKQHQEAIATIQVLERLQGVSFGTHRMRGMISWDQGDLTGALHSFRTMRQLDPTSAEAAACEARIQTELGDRTSAESTLRSAPRQHSEHLRAAWRRLIRVTLEEGEVEQARESVHFCLNDDPATRAWLKRDVFWSQHAGDLRIEEVFK
jgi:tetratricopeptide (TPR) repeat protein